MFKHFILVTAAIGMMAGASAQSWLTTGNSLAGTEKFGSTNNKSLDIITNNTVRMKINNKGNVGIGLTTLTTTDRLSVKNTTPAPTAIYTMTKGLFSEVVGNATSTYLNPAVAVYGVCDDNNGWGYGGYFVGDLYGSYGRGKYGIYGSGSNLTGSSEAYGVFGNAQGDGIINYGVYGTAPSDASDYNYGVAAFAGQSFFGNFALYAVDELGGPGAAGFFDGDVEYTGSIYDVSDAKFKSNVQDISNALDKISQLQPKTYDLRTEEFKGFTFGKGSEMGFIAQEVQAVFPELVKDCVSPSDPFIKGGKPNNDVPYTFLAVNYMGLIPVLTKGIQEQQELIDAQAAAIAAQQKSLEDLTARIQLLEATRNQTQSAVLTGTGARLEQNTPNPFTGITAVAYYIPESTRSAQLIISDLSGKEIETLEIDAMGNGTVQIDATQLAAGNYIYTLVADMAVVGTRMFSVSR